MVYTSDIPVTMKVIGMIKEQLDTTLEGLKQQRDELRVQLHLLNMEARDEWHEAERVWERMNNAAQRIRAEGVEQADEMVAAFRQLADELTEQYNRLRPMERLAEGMGELRQKRDELRVQAHLMSLEAKEEWDEVEHVWGRLTARLEKLKEASGEALEEAAEAARELKDNIAERYRVMKKRMKD